MAIVILVHGLWVNGWDMTLLQHRLNKAGFRALRFRYPTVRQNLAQNAERLYRMLSDIETEPAPHLVAHSLGGLLLCQLLHEHPDLAVGRIVTMASPHNGSLSALGVSRVPFIGKPLLGKSVAQGILSAKAPWVSGFEIGGIAGNRSMGLGRLFCDLPKPNDGTITVEETRMQGMSDHIVLPVNHMGMLSNALVARNVVAFLNKGRFLH